MVNRRSPQENCVLKAASVRFSFKFLSSTTTAMLVNNLIARNRIVLVARFVGRHGRRRMDGWLRSIMAFPLKLIKIITINAPLPTTYRLPYEYYGIDINKFDFPAR